MDLVHGATMAAMMMASAAVASVAVGTLQLAPKHGDVAANVARADELLEGRSEGLDVLVLPEMAFTGYLFPDEEAVKPLAEPKGAGPTFQWARATARRLRCAVVVGYVRLGEEQPAKLYNSQMLVGPEGQLVASYDKHFLFAADERWAQAGSGFQSVFCDWLGLRVGMGVCMDINPRGFEAPWGAFEFASFHKAAGTQLILFSSAWCNRHPDDEAPGPVDGPETLNYWANRLVPLIGSDTFFVAADRVGKEPVALIKPGGEGDVTFVGSSCVISLKEPCLRAHLGVAEEALLRTSIEVPFAKDAERGAAEKTVRGDQAQAQE